MKRLVLVLLGVFTEVACGAGAAEDGPVAFDLPTSVSRGGPVLAAPRVQAIYFAGFPYRPAIDDFLGKLAASGYWQHVAGEYGVGRPTILPGDDSAVTVPAQMAINDIPALFVHALTDHAAALGPPRGDTIYTLLFPPGITITGDGYTLCAEGAPSAFHAELNTMGAHVPVVVAPACPHFAGDSSLTGERALTPALSHEIVETTADPFPSSAPAFADTDDRHALWAVAVGGGEIADLCENEVPNLIQPADIGYPVQRIWSNAAAAASRGPCVPVPPGETYFNAIARLPDTVDVQLDANAPSVHLPALTAAVGAPASVNVDFVSQPNPPDRWKAFALEYQGQSTLDSAAGHPVSATGQRGQTQSVAVFAPDAPRSGVFPLIVVSVAPGTLHWWVGAIASK